MLRIFKRRYQDGSAYMVLGLVYLSMTPDQNYQPEYKEASAAAQKLLDQIDHGGCA
jgi:hypothetical protein